MLFWGTIVRTVHSISLSPDFYALHVLRRCSLISAFGFHCRVCALFLLPTIVQMSMGLFAALGDVTIDGILDEVRANYPPDLVISVDSEGLHFEPAPFRVDMPPRLRQVFASLDGWVEHEFGDPSKTQLTKRVWRELDFLAYVDDSSSCRSLEDLRAHKTLMVVCGRRIFIRQLPIYTNDFEEFDAVREFEVAARIVGMQPHKVMLQIDAQSVSAALSKNSLQRWPVYRLLSLHPRMPFIVFAVCSAISMLLAFVVGTTLYLMIYTLLLRLLYRSVLAHLRPTRALQAQIVGAVQQPAAVQTLLPLQLTYWRLLCMGFHTHACVLLIERVLRYTSVMHAALVGARGWEAHACLFVLISVVTLHRVLVREPVMLIRQLLLDIAERRVDVDITVAAAAVPTDAAVPPAATPMPSAAAAPSPLSGMASLGTGMPQLPTSMFPMAMPGLPMSPLCAFGPRMDLYHLYMSSYWSAQASYWASLSTVLEPGQARL